MQPKDFQLITDDLLQLSKIGRELAGKLGEKHNTPFRGGPRHGMSHIEINGLVVPSEVGVTEMMTDPPIFILQNISGFWNLYDQMIETLNQPIVQVSLRTMLETGYARIVGYSTLPQEEQKNRAIKYWLCTMGILYPDHPFGGAGLDRGKLYDSLTHLLGSDSARGDFEARRGKDDFVFFHKAMQNVPPSLLDEQFCRNMLQFVVDSLKLPTPDVTLTNRHVRSLSMYTHGNPVSLIHFSSDKKTQGHVLRSAKLMSQVGCAVAAYTQFAIGKEAAGSGPLYDLESKLRTELDRLWKERNKKLGT